MKREIKFRAWARDIMVDVVSIDFLNQYITWDGGQYDRCLPPNKCYDIDSFEDIIVMQFTGLVDKNGVEIYEGDIVKCHDHPTGLEDGIFEIYFFHGAFLCRNSTILLRDWGTAWTEVIGNIYETPEILTNEPTTKGTDTAIS